MEEFVYAGSSWAVTSYPDTDEHPATNLLREWNFSAFVTARKADSNLGQLKKITNLDTNLPVVFLYCEPLGDLEEITGLTLEQFVTSENWQEIWNQCNNACLCAIDKLKNPVALIGAHSDIDINNTTSFVIEHSWQKWLAQKTGMKVKDSVIQVTPSDGRSYSLANCWGAEVVHRFLHFNPGINPHPSLLDAVWDIYFFWEELQKRNWFFDVHPNYIANVEFAKYTKDSIKNFITKRK